MGGYLKISDQTYTALLYIILTFVAVRLLFFSRRQDDSQLLRALPVPWALLIGFGVGLFSGIIGIGGGILLSPVIIFARWGTTKQASSVASAFIFLNSLSGILGRLSTGTFTLDSFGLTMIPLGIAGALLGGFFGAKRLNGVNVRRVLGAVTMLAVAFFWFTYWS